MVEAHDLVHLLLVVWCLKGSLGGRGMPFRWGFGGAIASLGGLHMG